MTESIEVAVEPKISIEKCPKPPNLPPKLPINIRNICSFRLGGFGAVAWLCPFIAVTTTLAYTYMHADLYINTIQFCPHLTTHWQPISAFSGRYLPQSYIWMILIAAHFPARLLIPRIVALFYINITGVSYAEAGMCCAAIRIKNFPWEGVVEGFGLVLLSIVDMDTNVGIHETGFLFWSIGFIAFIFNDFYFSYHSKTYQMSCKKKFFLACKILIYIITLSVALANFFIYLAYKSMCSKEFYAWFIITEYIIVMANLVYHLLMIIEWASIKIQISIDFGENNLGNYLKEDTAMRVMSVHQDNVIQKDLNQNDVKL